MDSAEFYRDIETMGGVTSIVGPEHQPQRTYRLTRVGEVLYPKSATTLYERLRLPAPPQRLLRVLEWCDSAAEALLVYPFAMRPNVRVAGKRTLSDGKIIVSLQVCVRAYRIDFVVSRGDNAIAVEVDGGEWHRLTEDQATQDSKRQRDITAEGYSVIRFTAREVFTDAARCWSEVESIARRGERRRG